MVELFNSKALTGKLARWALIVQDFNPKISLVPRAVNHAADVFSRYIGAVTENDETLVTGHDADLNDSIRSAQRNDPFCQPLIYFLESDDPLQLPPLPVPLPEFSLEDDILVRHTYLTSKQGPQRYITQIVIPEQLVPTILYRIHSAPHAGHPGRNRTFLQARLLYYWPKMRLDIIKYVDKCQSCAENHGSVSTPVPIQSYPIPNEPWDIVAVDLLKLPLPLEGLKYLLVAIDHYTRFCILVPLKDKQASSVARALID